MPHVKATLFVFVPKQSFFLCVLHRASKSKSSSTKKSFYNFFPILHYKILCAILVGKSFLILYCPPAPLAPHYKNTHPTNNFVPMQYYVKQKQNRIAIKVTKNPSKTSSHFFEFFSVIFILAKSL